MDWTVIQYGFYLVGSIAFFAGSLIGLVVYLSR